MLAWIVGLVSIEMPRTSLVFQCKKKIKVEKLKNKVE